jgi:hypothetical protein
MREYGKPEGTIQLIQRGQIAEYQEIGELVIAALQEAADQLNEDAA